MLVVGGNGVEYRKATVSIIDSVHDLAVLNVEADAEYLNQQVKTGLEIIARDINISEKVAYAGFPLGNELLNSCHSPTYSEGVVGSKILEDTNPKMIQKHILNDRERDRCFGKQGFKVFTNTRGVL